MRNHSPPIRPHAAASPIDMNTAFHTLSVTPSQTHYPHQYTHHQHQPHHQPHHQHQHHQHNPQHNHHQPHRQPHLNYPYHPQPTASPSPPPPPPSTPPRRREKGVQMAARGSHWSFLEKARFEAALHRYGPFAWRAIIHAVGTRSEKQVKAYAARYRRRKKLAARAAISAAGAVTAVTASLSSSPSHTTPSSSSPSPSSLHPQPQLQPSCVVVAARGNAAVPTGDHRRLAALPQTAGGVALAPKPMPSPSPSVMQMQQQQQQSHTLVGLSSTMGAGTGTATAPQGTAMTTGMHSVSSSCSELSVSGGRPRKPRGSIIDAWMGSASRAMPVFTTDAALHSVDARQSVDETNHHFSMGAGKDGSCNASGGGGGGDEFGRAPSRSSSTFIQQVDTVGTDCGTASVFDVAPGVVYHPYACKQEPKQEYVACKQQQHQHNQSMPYHPHDVYSQLQSYSRQAHAHIPSARQEGVSQQVQHAQQQQQQQSQLHQEQQPQWIAKHGSSNGCADMYQPASEHGLTSFEAGCDFSTVSSGTRAALSAHISEGVLGDDNNDGLFDEQGDEDAHEADSRPVSSGGGGAIVVDDDVRIDDAQELVSFPQADVVPFQHSECTGDPCDDGGFYFGLS